jgi:hypothetical protein
MLPIRGEDKYGELCTYLGDGREGGSGVGGRGQKFPDNAQVCTGGHRKKLGKPLDDAQQNCL